MKNKIYKSTIFTSALLLVVSAIPAQAATLGVNFVNGGVAAEAIVAGENTNALNAIVGFTSPTWNNLSIVGAGSIADGRGAGTFSGVGVATYTQLAWASGSRDVVSGDASQKVFRTFMAADNDTTGTYFTGDGIAGSIHLTGLASYMTANSATSYTLTLFFSSDSNNAEFAHASVRSGIAGTPSLTAITDLALLGTVSDTLIGNGQAPINNAATGGGTRAWGSLSGLTADNIVVSVPPRASNSSVRGSFSGFAITAVPEPSTALLGGLGFLALLRRRR
jgi:hypothetical protein